MGVRDWLFIQSSPVVWLVTLADFQQIAGDRAPSFIQRSRPQQHQGAVSHLPELQVMGTTWEGGDRVRCCCAEEPQVQRDRVCLGSKTQRPKSFPNISHQDKLQEKSKTVYIPSEAISKTTEQDFFLWQHEEQKPMSNMSEVKMTFLNLPPLTSCQHVEVHLLNDFRSLLNY